MRAVRMALVGVLLMVGLLSGAGTAVAAPGLTWWTPPGGVPADGSLGVCTTDGSYFPAGQAVALQVSQNGSWVTRRTVGAPELQYSSCAYVSPTVMVATPGRYAFRAVTSGGTTALDGVATISVTKATSSVAWRRYVDYTYTTTKNRVVTVELSGHYGQVVALQSLLGRTWTTVSRVTAPRSGSADVLVPVPARAGQTWHRVVVYASPWSDTYVTPGFQIHQTDAVRYAGYIAQARRYMSLYCPNTPIFVDTVAVAAATGGNRIGQARSSSSGGSGGGTLSSRIELRSGLTGAALQHTAVHECAHVVQARTAVLGRYDVEEQRAEQAFPGTGFEGQADCMALQYSHAPERLYYVRGCSAAQFSEATRMWQALGQKYQANPYRWGS